MKIAILAGGKGTRLGLVDRPKSMVMVGGTPLLERLIETARQAGLTDIILLTGYMAEVIEEHFGDGERFGVRIAHVREHTPLGTAGAVRAARALFDAPFLLLYGDTLLDVDLGRMAAFHAKSGALATVFVHPNDHPQDSDLVEADESGRIVRLFTKPHADGALLPNLVSAALYVLDPAAIDYVSDGGASDWAHDIFPAMLDAGEMLCAYRSVEYIKDMGTPDRVVRGETDLASGRVARLSLREAKPAIFLDRDGVLNVEINGVHDAASLALTDEAAAAVRAVNLAGVPAICITNQPDIAKGLMSFDDLRAVSAALDTGLARGQAYLDDMFFCPHHPELGWPGEVPALKIPCECRKPAAGMLKAAAERHRIDLGRSWLIGDRLSDVAAAQAAGSRGILLGEEGLAPDQHLYPTIVPDHVAAGLMDAVTHALSELS